ncbi:hypothetical protein [Aeromonas veronii]|uniref:hypothetical protein n=1 Tax=Aeromonas veronii TaxID=654 RepID=UPI00123C5668|nr:hypothetical protein [Aeromonas veronii]QET79845.1 hypothetical protein FOB40_11580 [Aeromonas veronii]
MASQFNANAERDVREAQFCRVAIYPPVRGWVGERVHLEVSNSLETLGTTDAKTAAGYYLVVDGAEEARAEAARIRGKAVELVRVQS